MAFDQVRYARERREGFKRQGLCTKCGKCPARPNRTLCQQCHDVNHARYLRAKAQGQMTYYRRKAQGLCPKCGKVAPESPYTYCKSCRSRFMSYYDASKRFGGNRGKVIERDGARCRVCRWPERLVVHHIDGNGDESSHPNHSLDNLITLCQFCHGALSRLRRASLEGRELAAKLLVA